MLHPHQHLLLNFSLRKKTNSYFVLKSHCTLEYEGRYQIDSNVVKVICPKINYSVTNYWCGVTHWRN